MKRTTLIRALGVAALAAFILAVGSRSPESGYAQPPYNQPVTMSWDGVICIGLVASLPTLCTPVVGAPSPTTYSDTGTVGTLDIGDNPEQVSVVMLDVRTDDNPSDGTPPDPDPEEPFFAKAIQSWNGGIVAHPGGTITDGDQIGSIEFSLETNVLSPLSNNIDLADGQPPPRVIAPWGGPDTPPHIKTSFPVYDSTLALSPTVSQSDGGDAGTTPDTRDDNKKANCAAGSDGLMDGIDCMPAPLPAFIVSYGFPPHTFISRGFGVAPVFLGNKTDVHFLVFDLRVMQDPLVDFVTQAVVGYPGVPSALPATNNVTDQTVDTHPPFLVLVRMFGVTVGNAAHLPNPIPGGVANRTVYEDGTFNYDLAMFPNSDFDGDGLPNLYDLCDISDTAPAGPAGDRDIDDADRDGLTGVCDQNGPASNPGPYYSVCQPPAPPDHTCAPGSWGPGQDVDGDTFINYNDNCPNTPNGSGSDIQKDTDEDGVGDACDSDPQVPGRGAGGEISDGVARDETSCSGGVDDDLDGLIDGADPDCTGRGYNSFQDSDNMCRDQYTIPSVDAGNGAEPAEEPGAEGSKECVSAYSKATAHADYPTYSNPAMYHVLLGSTAYDLASKYNDSNNDGEPDWLPAVAGSYYDQDTDSDSDFDGHSDACEGAMGSDALDPSSVPGGAAVPGTPGVGGDCDNGGEADTSEGVNGRDITDPSDDISGLDTDGDGCADNQEETTMGGYDPTNGQDYYDVPVPANADPTPNGTKNKAVNLSDVLAILLYVPSSAGGPTNINGVDYDSDKNGDTQADGLDYDRSPSPAPNPPYDAGPPNGAINLSDVLAALAQVPKSCSSPGMTAVDIAVNQVRLTKNGVVQAPGSTVTLDISDGDYLDVQVEEHVITGPTGTEDLDEVSPPEAPPSPVSGTWDTAPKPNTPRYHVEDWQDSDTSNTLSVGDWVYLERLAPAPKVKNWYHVDAVAGVSPNRTMTVTKGLAVQEVVTLYNPPTGYYHCHNELAAISKDPVAEKVTWKNWLDVPRVKQYCTVEHIIVPGDPADQIWVDPNDPDPTYAKMIDAEVVWKLFTSTSYTKTVNLIRFYGEVAPPTMFDLYLPTPGSYPVTVCTHEKPHDSGNFADTATGNNYKCESYTIVVQP
jgi:hypothetical protein